MKKFFNTFLSGATFLLLIFIVVHISTRGAWRANFYYQDRVAELYQNEFCPGEVVYYKNTILVSKVPAYIREESQILSVTNKPIDFTSSVLIVLDKTPKIPRTYSFTIPKNTAPGKYRINHALRDESSDITGFSAGFEVYPEKECKKRGF